MSDIVSKLVSSISDTQGSMMWLSSAVSFLFVILAVWRLVGVNHAGISQFDYDNDIFDGINFILLALLGVVCTVWPNLCLLFARGEEKEDEGKPENDIVVVVDSPKDDAEREKSLRSLEVEVAKDEDEKESAAVEPVVAVKRNIVYLTNLKTFLTFMVVTHHTVCAFSEGLGLSTISFDTANPKALPFRTFTPGSMFLTTADQSYFMAAFFLISGYFCPKSLDRKGFRAFVLDKLVRLGGGFLLWTLVLAPLMQVWSSAYMGGPITVVYDKGPAWFILWLLNFSIIYAALAPFIPEVKFCMPHPLLLMLVGLGLGGVYYGMLLVIGDYNQFGGMNMWTYGIALYVPFFTAGIVGGRNDWLRSVEEMKCWVVWVLRAVVVIILGWTLYVKLHIYGPIPDLSPGKVPPGLGIFIDPCITKGVYSVVTTLALMQLFHQYFNRSPQSVLSRNAGAAAYTVYIIHFVVLNLMTLIFIEILKAAHVPIIFSKGSYMTVKNGDPELLSNAMIWLGWAFVFVMTQVLVWPLAHYFRKLPVLNKIL